MKLVLIREFDNGDETVGKLFYKNSLGDIKYLSTLEDEFRNKKIFGETRIPAGHYSISLRTVGRIYDKYRRHRNHTISEFTRNYGALQIDDVPNFKYILIHIGNDEDDTAGCILIGITANNFSWNVGLISNSTDAYVYFITDVKAALDRGENITIDIVDFDRMVSTMVS